MTICKMMTRGLVAVGCGMCSNNKAGQQRTTDDGWVSGGGSKGAAQALLLDERGVGGGKDDEAGRWDRVESSRRGRRCSPGPGARRIVCLVGNARARFAAPPADGLAGGRGSVEAGSRQRGRKQALRPWAAASDRLMRPRRRARRRRWTARTTQGSRQRRRRRGMLRQPQPQRQWAPEQRLLCSIRGQRRAQRPRPA